MAVRRRDQAWNPPSTGADVSALFAVLVGAPFLLPLIADLADLVFTIPLCVLGYAAVRAAAAARRRAGARLAWTALAAGSAAAALASALAVVEMVTSGAIAGSYYLGAAGSAGLLLGIAAFARQGLAQARFESLVDALLLSLLLTAIGVYFVAVPGLSKGDVLLTVVFLVDLAALLVASLSVFACGARRHRRVAWCLVATAAAVTAGDALVAAAAAGLLGWLPTVTALLWAAGGAAVATAAALDRSEGSARAGSGKAVTSSRRAIGQAVLPLLLVLSFPAIAATLAAAGSLTPRGASYFGLFFIAALLIAFGRQAYLVMDNERAAARERRLREQAVRRNEELEALTGLATTMTQTLEEEPIVENGLGVLTLAARATSSALHVGRGEALELHAAAGNWHSERVWARPPASALEGLHLECRGRRQVLALPIATRAAPIGVVTLMRPENDPFGEDELALLQLLVDQLAIAVQNARDYGEKLELSIRDPLTGLYNRRYFHEALEKEIQRTERYGSTACLILFDIDDFKSINDRHGHATGDEVLQEIGRIVEGLIRPADTFARIGGEEFGLLVPETRQLDGLLVAERLRTAISRHQILPGERVTLSGGVSSCPQDALASAELEKKADAALYWAKRNGKNLCAVASEALSSDTDERDGALAHLYGLVTSLDTQHLHTRDHSENVAAYAVALGQRLGLGREVVVSLRRAALLHDVGKVAVDFRILEKPSRLDDAEMDQIRVHSGVGGTMLCHAGLDLESSWVRHHHERVDGRGYPDGIAGDRIPLEARILFVADAFEAMTSDRPYRDGMPVEEAIAELRRNAGTQFDAQVVDALASLVEDGELTVLAVREEDRSVVPGP